MQAVPWLLVLALGLTMSFGCRQGGTTTAESTPTRAADEAPAARPPPAQRADTIEWAYEPCDAPDEVPHFDGMTETEVTRLLGPPTHKDAFNMRDRPDEFHVELQNVYPLSNPANANVEIRESTWHAGECRLTVWFHRADGEWTALQNVRWDRNTDY